MFRARPLVAALDFGGDAAVAVLVAIVLLPVVVALTIFLAEWLIVLAIVPLIMVAGASGRPWVIYAKSRRSMFQPITRGVGRPPLRSYRMSVRGWRASRRLLADVRHEIEQTGEPQSLGLPVADRPAGSALVASHLIRSLSRSFARLSFARARAGDTRTHEAQARLARDLQQGS